MTALTLMLVLAALTPEDELCSAIGKTSQAALQPRDRIFFEKNCACAAGDCAQKGGKRAAALQAEKARQDRAAAAAAKIRDGQFTESSAAVLAAARQLVACAKAPGLTPCDDVREAFYSECRRHVAAFPEEPTRCDIVDWEPKLVP